MSLYKQAGSDIWWTRFTHNGERIRRSTQTNDKPSAQKFEDKLRVSLHDTPKLKGKTWGTAVLDWANAQTRSDSDLQSLAKFGEHYADRALLNVTADSIAKALDKFVVAEGTYNRYLTRIHAVLRRAGVSVRVEKKNDKKPKLRTWLTHEQWNKLYAELPVHLQHSASFAILTGLRQANVLGLTWERVDLGRSMVWVESMDAKGGQAIGVPLSPAAVRVLKAVQSQHHEWCFTYRGKPYKEIKTAFQAAAIRAKVGRMVDGRYDGFTWHGLRHTWATWHAQNGTPLEVLQELGGWEDMRMLMKHYAHHVKGVKAKYVDNLGVKHG